MSVETTRTVGELAVMIPGAIPLFESLGIDYSCRGNRSLAEACDWAGVDADEIARELEASGANGTETNWFERNLSELIGYIIEEHHRFEFEKIRGIGGQLVQARDAGCDDLSVVRRLHALFTRLTDSMSGHMFHEERELFSRIARMERASNSPQADAEPWRMSVRSLILAEYVEHDQMSERLRKMREVSSNYTLRPGSCPECESLYANLVYLEKALHRHIHLENNVLFPRALELENRLKAAGKIA